MSRYISKLYTISFISKFIFIHKRNKLAAIFLGIQSKIKQLYLIFCKVSYFDEWYYTSKYYTLMNDIIHCWTIAKDGSQIAM